MSYSLSLFAGAGWQFFDNNGTILSGGKLYTYIAGTTTPLATYTSSSAATLNPNPIILDSAGRVPAEVWVNNSSIVKFALKTSDEVLIGTWDNIPSLTSSLNLTGTNTGVAYFDSVGTFTSGSNLTFDGTNLVVAGSATVGSNLYAAGSSVLSSDVSVGGALGVGGGTTLNGALTVYGDTTLIGTLTTSGATTLATGSTLTTSPATNDSSTKIATTAFCNPAYTAGTSGSVKLPSGLIIKWGVVSATVGTAGTILFPDSFPNSIFNVTASWEINPNGYVMYIYNKAGNGFSYNWNFWSTIGIGSSGFINYIAIGN